MRRREFIAILAGAAAGLPLAAQTQRKTLGIAVPPTLLARADQVIE